MSAGGYVQQRGGIGVRQLANWLSCLIGPIKAAVTKRRRGPIAPKSPAPGSIVRAAPAAGLSLEFPQGLPG